MNEGGKGGGEKCEVRRLVEEASAPRREEQESCQGGSDRLAWKADRSLENFWRMVHLLP